MENYKHLAEELKNIEKCDITRLPLKSITKVWKLDLFTEVPVRTFESSKMNFNLDHIENYKVTTGYLSLYTYKPPSSLFSYDVQLLFDKYPTECYICYVTCSFYNCTGEHISTIKKTFVIKIDSNTITRFSLKYELTKFTIVYKISYGCYNTTFTSIDKKTFATNNYTMSSEIMINSIELLINNEGLESPDLLIYTKDNCNMKMHSSVLNAINSSFQSMIKVENGRKTLFLPNNSLAVLEMIRFIYTNKINNMEEVAHDLFDIAHILNLSAMKEKCIHYLLKNISINNVVDYLTVANKWNVDLLETKTLSFIKNNYIKICATEKYKNLKLSIPNLEEKILSIDK